MGNCPDGCPCPDDAWTCPEANDPDDLAVLVLQHAGGNNKVRLILIGCLNHPIRDEYFLSLNRLLLISMVMSTTK